MSLFQSYFNKLKIGLSRYSHTIIRSYRFESRKEVIKYSQNNYIRKILRKTDGCILYNPQNTEYRLSPKQFTVLAENKTIVDLMQAARVINIEHKYDTRFAHQLLGPLNNQCFEQYKTWSIDEQLFALDLWNVISFGWDFPFMEEMISDFFRRFLDLKKAHALQVISYVTGSKRNLIPAEVPAVTERLHKNMDELTFDEVSINCLALFKGNVDRIDTNLVKGVFNYLMNTFDLRKQEELAVAGILKAIRKFSTIDHVAELHNLQDKLVPFAKEAEYITLTHIIQLGVKQCVFNTSLIRVITERFSKKIQSLRIKEIERALLVISTRNCRSEDSFEIKFCDAAQNHLLKSLFARSSADISYLESNLQCILYLAIFGIVDEKLINWALDTKTITSTADKKIERQLLLIDSYAKINLANTYSGNKLSVTECAQMMTKFGGSSTKLTDDISHVLQTSGVNCISIRPIPHIRYPYVVFGYNKRLKISTNVLNVHSHGRILEAKSLFENDSDVEAVAILPCLQRKDIDQKNNQFYGLFQLKIDQMKLLGFKTIPIITENWENCKTESHKYKLLASEIRNNGIFLPNIDIMAFKIEFENNKF